MHPVLTFPPYFPNIHFNIILLSMPKTSEWFLPFRYSNQNFVCTFHLSHACYVPCTSHPPCPYHPNNIWCGVQVMKPLIMQSSPASRHFLSLRSKYSPQRPVLFQLFEISVNTLGVKSQGSSVSMETRLRAGRPGFNSWQGKWWDSFSLHHLVQTDSRSHPASYEIGTGGSYLRG
jgi:hypothetical protein